MARLRRRVGLDTARITVPQPSDAVPQALVRVGQTAADIAYERGKSDAIQEATLRAQSLTFERDAAGNIIAPKLPQDKGLLGPSIFDEAYTQQVLHRYKQQVELDGSKRLQQLALENRLNPSGFAAASDAYVQAVTETALPVAKGDVKTLLEARALTHYNHIARLRAEDDFRKAKATHAEKMKDSIHEIVATAGSMPNPSEEIIAQVLGMTTEFGALVEEGIQFGFIDPFVRENAGEMLDKALASSLLGAQVATANDNVSRTAMVERLTKFAEGEGTLTMIVDGALTEVPVTDIFRTPEERQLIVEEAVGMLAATDQAERLSKGARFDHQTDEFRNIWSTDVMRAAASGTDPDMAILDEWYLLAKDAGNVPLQQEIANLRWRFVDDGGSTSKELENIHFALMEHNRRVTDSLVEQSEARGYESFNDAPKDVQMQMYQVAERRAGNVGAFGQTKECALFAEDYVAAWAQSNGIAEFRSTDGKVGMIYGGDNRTPLPDILSAVDGPLAALGILPRDMGVWLSGVLTDENVNNNEFQEAMVIVGEILKHPQLANNLRSVNGIGRVAADAAEHMLDIYSANPGSITSADFRDTLKNFQKTGYSPYEEWNAISDVERGVFANQFDEIFESQYNGFIDRLTNLADDDSGIWRRNIAEIPQLFREQVFGIMVARAGFIPRDEEGMAKHVGRAMETALSKGGWSISKLGYSQQKFTGEEAGVWKHNIPERSLVRFAPENFFKKQGQMKFVEEAFQQFLNEQDYKGVKLKAGENAALQYEPDLYDGQTRWFSVRVPNRDFEGSDWLTSNLPGAEGDILYINFDEALGKWEKWYIGEKTKEQERTKLRRKMSQSFTQEPYGA